MVSESIVFSPEVDERQLDRETSAIDEELESVGEDIAVSFDPEDMDMENMGAGGGVPGGIPGGGGGGGMAGIAAGGGLASKIPNPVAGVTASAALPVALAGGVGLGMLSAMSDASARMQTSADLLGQSWNNLFRPLGDKLDQLFIRDFVKDLRDDTQSFAESFTNIDGGIVPDSLGQAADRLRAAADLLDVTQLTWVETVSDAIDGVAGVLDSFSWPTLPRFSWPTLPEFPGWPDVSAGWDGWPDLGSLWPGWDAFIPTADIDIDIPGGVDIDESGGDRGSPGGGGGGNDGQHPSIGRGDQPGFGLATGGRVQSTGVATVHRGELVADENRLVNALSDAIDAPDQTPTMDTGRLENKLDRIEGELKTLRRSMDITVELDRETIARASADGQRNRVGDTDPTV